MKRLASPVSLLVFLALAGHGGTIGSASQRGAPFQLPVGSTEWDVSSPAWPHEGRLRVGKQTVELGHRVLIVTQNFPETPAKTVTQLGDMVESIRFLP